MAGDGRRRAWLVAAVVVALLLVGGGAYALLSLRTSDSPAPAALDEPAPTSAGSTATSGQAAAADSADGSWQISGDGSSFVGYRVREQLAFVSSPSDAVGRSTAVTGTMQVTGDQVEAVRVEADLTRLESDEARRDNAIRQNGLQSNQFPTATFELTEPIRLDQAPADGQQVTGMGKGRLTAHGVTREVTVDLRGRWDGDIIQVAGQLPIRMTDYGIQPPRIGPVVSIEDGMTVEFRLRFERA
jgi:polyisoprenoid-binding protein YceI